MGEQTVFPGNLRMGASPTTRASLILRLSNRDDASAWEEFVGLYSPLIERVARQRGLQRADAAEVVQDVLMAVVRAIDTYQVTARTGSFRKWLSTIAKNKALNRLTRQPLDQRLRASGIEPEHLCGSEEARLTQAEVLHRQWQEQLFVMAAEHVRKQVQPQTWSAFWLAAVEDKTPEQVAKELDMDVGNVYVARSRTLAKIRQWVQQHSARWEESNHDR